MEYNCILNVSTKTCVKTYIAEMNLFYFSSHATPFLFTISGRVSHTLHSRSVKAGRQSGWKHFSKVRWPLLQSRMLVSLLDIAFENTFSYDLLFRNTRNHRLVIEQNRMCIDATRCIVRVTWIIEYYFDIFYILKFYDFLKKNFPIYNLFVNLITLNFIP